MREGTWCDSAAQQHNRSSRPRVAHPLVGDLVAALVRGDGAADLGQHVITVLQRVAGGVAVGDLRAHIIVIVRYCSLTAMESRAIGGGFTRGKQAKSVSCMHGV